MSRLLAVVAKLQKTARQISHMYFKMLISRGGGGGTYLMISYVSKENNLGPGDKIRFIWGLKGSIFIL